MENTVSEAYDRANMADRIAAFGGCLVVNRPMDKQTAEMASANYLEVVAAPGVRGGRSRHPCEAQEPAHHHDSRRSLILQSTVILSFVEFKSLIDGGIIVQQSQKNAIRTKRTFRRQGRSTRGGSIGIERKPTDREYDDMLFGWNVEQGITSNSVIYVKDGVTVGIGTGEQDRVGVAEIAIFKAYTKYADALCFRKYGVPYKQYELEAGQGKRDKGALAGDR